MALSSRFTNPQGGHAPPRGHGQGGRGPVPDPRGCKKPYADLKTGERRLLSLNTNARTNVLKLRLRARTAKGDDGWSLWQAVVEYSDYYSNVKGKDLESRRAERVMTGRADDLKDRAMQLILA